MKLHPARGPATRTPTPIQLSQLVDEARRAVRGDIAAEDAANAALRSIIEVGTSAGGARAKAVIAWNPTTHEIRTGQLTVPRGFEHWLLKFDGMGADQELGASTHYGRIEYAYFLMARAAGINISESRLLEENGRAHFMTRRFDRHDDERHHMQTLCAMAHLDYKQKGTNSYAWFSNGAGSTAQFHRLLVEEGTQSQLKSLSEYLLRAGVAHRHVRRYIRELHEHYEDALREEPDKGLDQSAAEQAALESLPSFLRVVARVSAEPPMQRAAPRKYETDLGG